MTDGTTSRFTACIIQMQGSGSLVAVSRNRGDREIRLPAYIMEDQLHITW
jgi:hypothetical protein